MDPLGLVHLFDRDFTALCACRYGWLTGRVERCTCPSCLSLLDQARDVPGCEPLVDGVVRMVGH